MALNTTLLAQFLDESPLLRELEFELTLTTVDDFCILLAALIRSHLEFLKIKIDKVSVILMHFILEVDSTMDILPKNSTVRRLHIEDNNSEFYNLFVKYFRNVDDLRMVPVRITNNLRFPVSNIKIVDLFE